MDSATLISYKTRTFRL